MSASPKQPDASLAIRTKDAPKQQQQQRNPQLQSTADAKPVANSSSHRNPKHRPGRKTAAEVAVASAKPLPSAAVPSAVNPTKKKKKFPRQVAGGANDGVVEKKASEPAPAPTWKLSPFLGGRYAELDPVFTKDEKHLLVAQSLTLKIYSTKTSLLVRSITITDAFVVSNAEYIVSYFLDPRSDDRVYIATSGSKVFLHNVATGELVQKWNIGVGHVRHVCVCAGQALSEDESEVLYVAAGHPNLMEESVWRVSLIVAKVSKTEIYRSRIPIVDLRVADAGKAVCLISGRDIAIVNSNGAKWLAPRVYKMAIELTCMDVYSGSSATPAKKGKKGGAKRGGDVVVGDTAGAIYVLHDVIKSSKVEDHTPMKLHWHRLAVSSVKWALDGAYIVSGGLETVLVIWQLETGHKQFLPHLGAAIKNIVISPRGSSYALSLSDNSVMTLSTSELKPKTNIAGIQSTAQIRRSRESRVVPCLLHPTLANNLLIATPSNQLDQSASSPYLQTFDTYSDRHISRQALARTNATIINQGPDKTLVSEPDILFLAATNDGKWLASVDEWQPSKKNALGEETTLNLHSGRKREVYLKFWNWNEPRKEWELITRVDAPHPSPEEMGSESILDLIAAPNGQAFATVGADGCVKIWKPKVRARPGQTAAESGVSWGYRKSINFSKQHHDNDTLPIALTDEPAQTQAHPRQWWGNVAFSEDSSVLAVSCPGPGFGALEDSLIHIIDPATGAIRQSLGGLHIGRTTGLAILERYLIVAGSQKLLVWNLVHGSVEWEYTVEELATNATSPSLHLAVDHHEQTFAVAFSLSTKKISCGKVLVWGPASDPSPVYSQQLDSSVVALKPAGAGKGFMVLDGQARVQYVTPVLTPHTSVASIVASGQEVEEAEPQMLSGLYINDKKGETEMMEVDADDAVEKVVAREALETVFDEISVYESGSVVAAFDRVMGLFAKAPLGEDDEEEEEEETVDSDMLLEDA